ncbi:MAG: riboflavin synthase [Candidatus Acidiferrum sp.]
MVDFFSNLLIAFDNEDPVFTGIIEHLGIIASLSLQSDGGRITIHAPHLAANLAVANSIAVNGCCLTIVSLDAENFSADLSGETVRKTTFRNLAPGDRVNLEQPLTAGKEFGGHFVLGHVDTVGRVVRLGAEGDSWWYAVEVPQDFSRYVVSKGSITIDGISLTVARWHNAVAEVAVIPFTYEHTNIRSRKPGDLVNLEGDVLGKYIERHLESLGAPTKRSTLTLEKLVSEGF